MQVCGVRNCGFGQLLLLFQLAFAELYCWIGAVMQYAVLSNGVLTLG